MDEPVLWFVFGINVRPVGPPFTFFEVFRCRSGAKQTGEAAISWGIMHYPGENGIMAIPVYKSDAPSEILERVRALLEREHCADERIHQSMRYFLHLGKLKVERKEWRDPLSREELSTRLAYHQ